MSYVIITWDLENKDPVTKVTGIFQDETECKEHILSKNLESSSTVHELHYDFALGKGWTTRWVILTWDYGQVTPITEVIGIFASKTQAKAHVAHQGWDLATVHQLRH